MAHPSLICCALLVVLIAPALAADVAPVCDDCKWVARLVEDALCDAEIDEKLIEFFQDQVCARVGKDHRACDEYAEALLPVAIDWLRGAATPASLCSAAGVCSSAELASSLRVQQIRARRAARTALQFSLGCSLCEYLVVTVKTEIDDPARLEKIKQRLLEACSELPPQVAPSCTDLVTNYGDVLIAAIEHMDANATCTAVGLCTPPSLMKLQSPALPLPAVHLAGRVRALAQRAAATNGPNGELCDLCRITVVEANTYISNPSVQQQVINFTMGLCDRLGDSASTCKLYVAVYAPAVFVMLQQYLQPDPVCQYTKLCAPTAGPAGAALLQAGSAVDGMAAGPDAVQQALDLFSSVLGAAQPAEVPHGQMQVADLAAALPALLDSLRGQVQGTAGGASGCRGKKAATTRRLAAMA